MCVFDAVSHRGVGQGVFVSVCVLQPFIDEVGDLFLEHLTWCVCLCVCLLDFVCLLHS